MGKVLESFSRGNSRGTEEDGGRTGRNQQLTGEQQDRYKYYMSISSLIESGQTKLPNGNTSPNLFKIVKELFKQ